jgi:elongation factor Tu
MSRGKFERTKPHVNIKTIGHVDIILLVAILYGLELIDEYEAYAASEERERGITINTDDVNSISSLLGIIRLYFYYYAL